jgi:poly-gamma-glutamate capsule biosynthesis protein CapA/YwtB (metallophosphatase superfamily)
MDPATGDLASLRMKPTHMRKFNRASKSDALWLRDMLNREGKRFGTRVEMEEDTTLVLHWRQ